MSLGDWLLVKYKRCRLCGLRLEKPETTLMAYCPSCSRKQHDDYKRIFAGVEEEVEARRAALNRDLDRALTKDPERCGSKDSIGWGILGIILGIAMVMILVIVLKPGSNANGVHGRPVEAERRTERLPQGRGEDF